MKPSAIWFAAAKAAEAALPIESLGLVANFDALHQKWVEAGCPCDPNHGVITARRACEGDPRTAIVLDLRGKACDALYLEHTGKLVLTPEQAGYALREGA